VPTLVQSLVSFLLITVLPVITEDYHGGGNFVPMPMISLFKYNGTTFFYRTMVQLLISTTSIVYNLIRIVQLQNEKIEKL